MIAPLDIFGFLHLGLTDILDILLVALLIFVVFRWIRGSAAMNIFYAVIFIYVAMVVADALHMKMMSRLVETFIDVGVLAIIVIFQPEIRHALLRVGTGGRLGRRGRSVMAKILGSKAPKLDNATVNEVTEACRMMSDQKTGALIVIPHDISLESYIETGDRLDALVNRRLLMNLFFKNSPLHDGAVILGGDRVVAARCTLPITSRTDIPAQFGMRHKAAIGLTEETDADVIVVSEETGRISFAKAGKVTTISNINELKLLLGAAFSQTR